MNIAIFGGSFDPPHNGHDGIVKTALKSLNIDKLIIIPTFLNPFKEKFNAPPNLRLKWCKTLWNDQKIIVSDYEITQNKVVRAYENVVYFRSKFNALKCYFIIGADQLENLHKWYKFRELNKLCEFIIATRENIDVPVNLQKLPINAKISSTKIRNELDFSEIPAPIYVEVTKFYKENYAKQN